MNIKIKITITLCLLFSVSTFAIDDGHSVFNEAAQMEKQFEEQKKKERIPNKTKEQYEQAVHSFENDAIELDVSSKKHN